MGIKFWTKEKDAILREMWCNEHDCDTIAKATGAVSRNAVIGRAHRLCLPKRDSTGMICKNKPPKTVKWYVAKYRKLGELSEKGYDCETLARYFKTSSYDIKKSLSVYNSIKKTIAKKDVKPSNGQHHYYNSDDEIHSCSDVKTHRCLYCSNITYVAARTCYSCAYIKAA